MWFTLEFDCHRYTQHHLKLSHKAGGQEVTLGPILLKRSTPHLSLWQDSVPQWTAKSEAQEDKEFIGLHIAYERCQIREDPCLLCALNLNSLWKLRTWHTAAESASQVENSLRTYISSQKALYLLQTKLNQNVCTLRLGRQYFSRCQMMICIGHHSDWIQPPVIPWAQQENYSTKKTSQSHTKFSNTKIM